MIKMCRYDLDYAVFFIAIFVTNDYDNHDIEYMSTYDVESVWLNTISAQLTQQFWVYLSTRRLGIS